MTPFPSHGSSPYLWSNKDRKNLTESETMSLSSYFFKNYLVTWCKDSVRNRQTNCLTILVKADHIDK